MRANLTHGEGGNFSDRQRKFLERCENWVSSSPPQLSSFPTIGLTVLENDKSPRDSRPDYLNLSR